MSSQAWSSTRAVYAMMGDRMGFVMTLYETREDAKRAKHPGERIQEMVVWTEAREQS